MAEIENTGIIDELLAELKEKNTELSRFKNGHKSIVYFSSPFEVSKEDPLEVRGIFLTEGMWNNDFYSEKIAKSIEEQIKSRNIPVLVEHGKTSHFGSKSVGKTTEGEYNDIIKGTLGRVEITDPEVKRLIKEKKLRGFSVRGEVDKQPENGNNRIDSFNLFEISMVEDPACDISFVAFSKDLLNKLKEKPKEGKLMAKETVPVEKNVELELKEGQVIALVVMGEEEAKEKKYPYSYGEPGKEKYEYPKKKEVAKSLEELSELYDNVISRIENLEEKLAKKEEEEEEEEKPKKKEEEEEIETKKTPEEEEEEEEEEKKKKKEAFLEAESKKVETPTEKPPETKKEEIPPIAAPEKSPEAKTEIPPISTPTSPPATAPEAPKSEAKTDIKKLEEELSPGEALILQKKILKEPE